MLVFKPGLFQTLSACLLLIEELPKDFSNQLRLGVVAVSSTPTELSDQASKFSAPASFESSSEISSLAEDEARAENQDFSPQKSLEFVTPGENDSTKKELSTDIKMKSVREAEGTSSDSSSSSRNSQAERSSGRKISSAPANGRRPEHSNSAIPPDASYYNRPPQPINSYPGLHPQYGDSLGEYAPPYPSAPFPYGPRNQPHIPSTQQMRYVLHQLTYLHPIGVVYQPKTELHYVPVPNVHPVPSSVSPGYVAHPSSSRQLSKSKSHSKNNDAYRNQDPVREQIYQSTIKLKDERSSGNKLDSHVAESSSENLSTSFEDGSQKGTDLRQASENSVEMSRSVPDKDQTSFLKAANSKTTPLRIKDAEIEKKVSSDVTEVENDYSLKFKEILQEMKILPTQDSATKVPDNPTSLSGNSQVNPAKDVFEDLRKKKGKHVEEGPIDMFWDDKKIASTQNNPHKTSTLTIQPQHDEIKEHQSPLEAAQSTPRENIAEVKTKDSHQEELKEIKIDKQAQNLATEVVLPNNNKPILQLDYAKDESTDVHQIKKEKPVDAVEGIKNYKEALKSVNKPRIAETTKSKFPKKPPSSSLQRFVNSKSTTPTTTTSAIKNLPLEKVSDVQTSKQVINVPSREAPPIEQTVSDVQPKTQVIKITDRKDPLNDWPIEQSNLAKLKSKESYPVLSSKHRSNPKPPPEVEVKKKETSIVSPTKDDNIDKDVVNPAVPQFRNRFKGRKKAATDPPINDVNLDKNVGSVTSSRPQSKIKNERLQVKNNRVVEIEAIDLLEKQKKKVVKDIVQQTSSSSGRTLDSEKSNQVSEKESDTKKNFNARFLQRFRPYIESTKTILNSAWNRTPTFNMGSLKLSSGSVKHLLQSLPFDYLQLPLKKSLSDVIQVANSQLHNRLGKASTTPTSTLTESSKSVEVEKVKPRTKIPEDVLNRSKKTLEDDAQDPWYIQDLKKAQPGTRKREVDFMRVLGKFLNADSDETLAPVHLFPSDHQDDASDFVKMTEYLRQEKNLEKPNGKPIKWLFNKMFDKTSEVEVRRRWRAITRQFDQSEIFRRLEEFQKKEPIYLSLILSPIQIVDRDFRISEPYPTFYSATLQNNRFVERSLESTERRKLATEILGPVELASRVERIFGMSHRLYPHNWLPEEELKEAYEQGLNTQIIIIVGDLLQFGRTHFSFSGNGGTPTGSETFEYLLTTWSEKCSTTPWAYSSEKAWFLREPNSELAQTYQCRINLIKEYSKHVRNRDLLIKSTFGPWGQYKGEPWWNLSDLLEWQEYQLDSRIMVLIGEELKLDKARETFLEADKLTQVIEKKTNISKQNRHAIIEWFKSKAFIDYQQSRRILLENQSSTLSMVSQNLKTFFKMSLKQRHVLPDITSHTYRLNGHQFPDQIKNPS